MNYETPKVPEENTKEIFMSKARSEVDRLVAEARITPEEAEEKLASAELIETGLSDDPEYDARQFVGAGVYTEEEMVALLSEKERPEAGL
jgi:hypothetical protein